MSIIFGLLSYVVQIVLMLALFDCAYYMKKIYGEMAKKNEREAQESK